MPLHAFFCPIKIVRHGPAIEGCRIPTSGKGLHVESPVFFIRTLGCKVNQEESDAIAACLEGAGWGKTAKIPEASVLILNTCTVTGNAGAGSRQELKTLRENNPEALLLVTGCAAQMEGPAMAAMNCADYILSHKDKHKIPGLLFSMVKNRLSCPSCHDEKECTEIFFRDIPAPPQHRGRTRAFLKVQDGCNAFCSYCIVPYARGRSRSLLPDLVLQKARGLFRAGFSEIVLAGIHVGMYGADLAPATELSGLLDRLLAETPGPRFRLGSLEPVEVSDKLIDKVLTEKNLCSHFHVPMQSGSDTILKVMGRPYAAALFSERVEKIRKGSSVAAIGTDIMTGFPGENEELFEESLERVRALPLTYLHVFPYSPRPGTPAADFPDQVPMEKAKKRAKILRALSEEKKRAFAESLEGKVLDVLFERRRDRRTGKLKGLTDNYQVILAEGDDLFLNRRAAVKVAGRLPDGKLSGILLP